MHLIYQKKHNHTTSDRPGVYTPYTLCPDCYYEKQKHWDDRYSWFSRSYEQVLVEDNVSYTCYQCHRFIQDLPEYVPDPPRWRNRKRQGRGHWDRQDTRRVNAAGKMIGGHNGHPCGWHPHTGKYYKTLLHRVERRYWKRYVKAMIDNPEMEPNVSTGSMISIMSEVSWKLW